MYLRLEEVIVITDTGYDNVSAFVTMDIDEVEKLMAEQGMFERDAPRNESTAPLPAGGEPGARPGVPPAPPR